MKIRALLTAAALTAALPALAQENADTPPPAEKKTPPKGQTAKAQVKDSEGKDVGEITLEQTKQGILIKGKLSNLPPGQHAFHIHEVGKCEGPDFKSSGGHFNPTGASHGFASEKGPHAGDLPNIHVPESGTLRVEYYTQMVTLKEGEANSLLGGDGTSLMIHEGPDDHKTDPAGHAGGRIACGVITR